MLNLFRQVAASVQQNFIPHYKEDMFRTLFATEALKSGWAILEPRMFNATLVPPGQTAVRRLSWDGATLSRTDGFVDLRGATKPDLRLVSPWAQGVFAELKAGFTGSAAEGNSNHTRVAADIDLVADESCDVFCGLFDAGMFNRLQGRLSTAGRGQELAGLLGNAYLGPVPAGVNGHSVPQFDQMVNVTCVWKGTDLTTTMTALACGCNDSLAAFIVRRTDDGW